MAEGYSSDVPNVDNERITSEEKAAKIAPLREDVYPKDSTMFRQNSENISSSVEIILESFAQHDKGESREVLLKRILSLESKNAALKEELMKYQGKEDANIQADKTSLFTKDTKPLLSVQDGKIFIDKATLHEISTIKSPVSTIAHLGRTIHIDDKIWKTETGVTTKLEITSKESPHTVISLDTYVHEKRENAIWRILFTLTSFFIFWIKKPEDEEQLADFAAEYEKKQSEIHNENNETSPQNILVIYHNADDMILTTGSDDANKLIEANPDGYLERKLAKYNLSKSVLCKMKSYQVTRSKVQKTMKHNVDSIGTLNTLLAKAAEKSPELVWKGFTMNGERLSKLLEAKVESTNKNDNSLLDHFLMELKQGTANHLAKSVIFYQNFMEQQVKFQKPCETAALENFHANALENTIQFFQSIGMKGNLLNTEVTKLKREVHNAYKRFEDQNEKASREKCEHLLNECFQDVKMKVTNGYYHGNSDEIYQDRQKATEQYNASPGKGPLSTDMLQTFLGELETDEQKSLHSGQLSYDTDTPPIHKQKIQKILEQYNQHGKQIEDLLFNLSEENEAMRKQIARLKMTNSQTDGVPSKEETSPTNTDVLRAGHDKEFVHLERPTKSGERHNQTNGDNRMTIEQLEETNQKLQEQLKKMQRDHAEWETHCKLMDENHSGQLTGLLQELNECKKTMKHLEIKLESKQHQLVEMQKESEQKVKNYDEQRKKAISFASAQAEKVDDLKKTLRKEQLDSKGLNEEIVQLRQTVSDQEKEIRALKRRSSLLNTSSMHDSNHRSLGLNLENRPPLATQRQENRMPPSRSLQMEAGDVRADGVDKSLMLRQTQDEKEVLKQQITIYKEDFDTERRDRERAQSEIATLKNTCSQMSDDMKALQEELRNKNRDVEALRAAREQEGYQIQMKQDQIRKLQATVQAKVVENRDLQTQIEVLRRQQYSSSTGIAERPPPYEYTQKPKYQTAEVHNPVRQDSNDSFLSQEWRRQIQSNFSNFRNYLRPSDVIVKLYMKNIISHREKQELDALNIDYRKADYIINKVILRGTKKIVLEFKQILIDTDQAELAKMLPDDTLTIPGRIWKCGRCTYDNPAHANSCEMCNLPVSQNAQYTSPGDRRGAAVEQCDDATQRSSHPSDHVGGLTEYDFQVEDGQALSLSVTSEIE